MPREIISLFESRWGNAWIAVCNDQTIWRWPAEGTKWLRQDIPSIPQDDYRRPGEPATYTYIARPEPIVEENLPPMHALPTHIYEPPLPPRNPLLQYHDTPPAPEPPVKVAERMKEQTASPQRTGNAPRKPEPPPLHKRR